MNTHPAHQHDHKQIHKLALGALGVVFGDIGTSPLYAVKECFSHGLTATPENVLGVISLIFWGLTIVVSLKYALLIMRADNHGEGGVFSLLALALRAARRDQDQTTTETNPAIADKKRIFLKRITLLGMFGAALFFGDSMVTPAISVLSAVEGLNLIAPQLDKLVLPITIAILVTLFALQRFGSQKIGNSFGPIMIIWFTALTLLGLKSILQNPMILNALNPIYAIRLIVDHGWLSFAILGAALLAFTGGEALYADMGHFGLKSIRLAWYVVAMPALTMNYLGQGALLLANPEAVNNPFYMLAPTSLLLPMILLASMATVIASQGVISGTFSVVRQAMQMDYLPRFSITHTSHLEQGQIYLPKVNLFLCLSVVMLVLLFRSSNALAGAYGFAVGGAMLIDTLLTAYVAKHVWQWRTAVIGIIFVPFLLFDLTFFTTAAAKIFQGGWLPLIIALSILTVFVTWKRGRVIVNNLRQLKHEPLELLVERFTPEWPARVKGTSVYLAPTRSKVPPLLQIILNRYQTLRENVIVLKIMKEDVPYVPEEHQAFVHPLGKGVWQMVLHYGFMQEPHISEDVRRHLQHFPQIDLDDLIFFIGRSIFVSSDLKNITPGWRKALFLWLANNVEEDFQYARMPSEQLVQIGTQIEV